MVQLAVKYLLIFVCFVSLPQVRGLGAAIAEVESELPNVVLILVDDMGYGDVGCYNAESKIDTPHIDALASAGMRFTDAHAAGPLCHMSRYGLMTGRYPFRTDVSKWPTQALIEKDQVTVASLLSNAGYQTAMIGKWHLGFHENGYDRPLPGGPVHCGFDSFFGIRASTDIPPYFYIRDQHAVAPPTAHIEANESPGWSPIQGKFWRAGGIAPGLELKAVLPKFTEEAISVIDTYGMGDRNKPLMLYLAYPAPHTPWLPAQAFTGKSGAGLYGDFCLMVDAMIGQVLESLERNNITENTLVIFSSDNGPVWYDKDKQRFGHQSTGHFRGIKGDAWEGGHRMPFIARWPDRIKAGTSSDQLISFVDLMATLAAITNTPLPATAGPDSFDFSRVLFGLQQANLPIRKSLALRSGNQAMMVRMGDWKLIDQLGSGGFSKPSKVKPVPGGPAGQLYHLGSDPGETKNLYGEKPEMVHRLSAILKAIIESPQTRPR